MNLSEIAKILHCDVKQDLPVNGISIDSRKVGPGQLFIAITGENFDGHDFVAQAAQNGAVAAIVSKDIVGLGIPLLKVNDTQQALANIAQHHRNKFNLPVIALTGSCGKTTVKEMIAAILATQYKVFSSPGNFNNHIGVPLSILRLDDSYQAAVFELGASHKGEIAFTVDLVRPKVALINNVAPAHLAGFGSIEGVMQAKSEIYNGLDAQGIAVFNADDDYAATWRKSLANVTQLTFGIKHQADITASNIRFDMMARPCFKLITPNDEIEIQLNVSGAHNVSNALAACAAAMAVKVPLSGIKQGLENFNGVPGRMAIKTGIAGATIIDDSYNANLKSVLAALEVLAKLEGRRILVLGDMAELGEAAAEHHRLIGEKARQLGIDNLFTCGKLSRFAAEAFANNSDHHHDDQTSLVGQLLPELNNKTSIVVKGSRSAHMEHVVAALMQASI